MQSLRLNADTCRTGNLNAVFVQEDLNELGLVENSVDIIVMADFLQHLGGRAQRERLLTEALGALNHGGHFFLSFFNLNIKNYIKGDVHGGFEGGKIRYERLTLRNVTDGLPEEVMIDKIAPMNIAHGARLDRILSALPFSTFLARMVVVVGRKNSP
jgi:SAM-dependent methyltransferase